MSGMDAIGIGGGIFLACVGIGLVYCLILHGWPQRLFTIRYTKIGPNWGTVTSHEDEP